MKKKVIVARIGAAHGVRGEVRLWPFTQEPLAVAGYGALESEDGKRTFEIESVRLGSDHLIARFKGVNDRTAAETLRNIDLYIPRDRLPEIDEDDTYYHSDLVGLDALREDGTPIGAVHAIHNFGAGDVIEIMLPGGNTLMLPFTETTVPKVDLEARRIVVVPPAEVEARPSSHPPLKGEGRPRSGRGGVNRKNGT
ncbi:MAG: 16S rRNA processing protein RimM [Pseudolabrys sp.]|jgi:16S rRNA processing protein RimM|nr:16S rRNA processing protein RimM [Pseudolabrys sp.]